MVGTINDVVMLLLGKTRSDITPLGQLPFFIFLLLPIWAVVGEKELVSRGFPIPIPTRGLAALPG